MWWNRHAIVATGHKKNWSQVISDSAYSLIQRMLFHYTIQQAKNGV